MKVAFDIASYPVFKDGDLFYPGLASLLAIINCGGEAIIFSSNGSVSLKEIGLIKKLGESFSGRITYAEDAGGADMCVC